MKLLLDTHFVLAVIDQKVDAAFPAYSSALATGQCMFSIVSLWEIAIKARLGKLATRVTLDDMAGALESQGVMQVGLSVHHIVAEAEPAPATRDPFDRLLLATAQIEGWKLVTVDRALAGHPAAFRPAQA